MRTFTRVAMMLAVLLTSAPAGWAQETVELQFLDNPEQLQPMPGVAVDRIYMAEGIATRLGDYDALIIEQPEIFLHPDSKYKGIKPDALKHLADHFAASVTAELEGFYKITSEAGPRVLHFRWALTNLRLKYKWSKNPLSYTPVGAVTSAVQKAVRNDITKKVALKGVVIELELLDSQTGERLAAAIESRHRQDEPTSWPELEEMMHTYGKLLKCRLDNARLPRRQWIDCVGTFVKTSKG